jgi:hypothetical protein
VLASEALFSIREITTPWSGPETKSNLSSPLLEGIA